MNAWANNGNASELITGDSRTDYIHTPFLSRFLKKDTYAVKVLYSTLANNRHILVVYDVLDRRITMKIDQTSNQLVEESWRDLTGGFHIVKYSEFKEFGGLTLATRIESSMIPPCDGCSQETKRNQILNMTYKINNVIVDGSGIDPKMFERPVK